VPSEPSREAFDAFLAAIERCAWPATRQAAWLAEHDAGPLADELALGFDTGYVQARGFAAAGWLTEEELEALAVLDQLFDVMSSAEHADFWDVASLAFAPEWQVVRDLAERFLERRGAGG
jgi:hypothetical protein